MEKHIEIILNTCTKQRVWLVNEVKSIIMENPFFTGKAIVLRVKYNTTVITTYYITRKVVCLHVILLFMLN